MSSRRDLYQSYQFMIQRLVSSIVLRESDPLRSPMRRMVGSGFGGVMIAIIALAVAGVIGMVSPGGNKSWQSTSGIIVEKETGAQYVWLADQAGVYHLHPVPNMGSGVLLSGSSNIISVSRRSLEGAPRGVQLGIPDTLTTIPEKKNLLGQPWTLCSLPAEDRDGQLLPNTALAIGQAKTRGTDIGSDEAVILVDIETNQLYVVWNSHRFLIPNPQSALPALGIASATQIRVGTAWLTSLPAGKDLAATPVPGQGQPSPSVPGHTIGEVVQTNTAGGVQNYQVHSEGLMPVSGVEAALSAQANGSTASIDPAQVSGVPVLNPPAPDPADLPTVMPEIHPAQSADSTVCASFGENPATPQISIEAGVEGAEKVPASQRRQQDGAVLADRVAVAPGHGALVESMASPNDLDGALFLVTDDGRRYALPDRQIVDTLGYGGVAPVKMPASLVDRIEHGSAMDAAQAKHPI